MVKKKVVLTAFARSGTRGITQFCLLYGIQAKHQALPFPDVTGCYDIMNPPEVVTEYIQQKTLLEFEACWSFSYVIYQMQQANPEVEFLIMIRNPKDTCNSMLHFFHQAARDHIHYNYDMHPEATLDTCANKYNEIYIMLIRQILAMNPRPRFLKFGDYIQGKYTEPLLDLFEIEKNEENLEKAEEFLTHKVNSLGEYDSKNTQRHFNVFPLFNQGEQLFEIIEQLCQELS